MQVRLQKYLASTGLASRRKCEEYIKKGLIKVNGAIVKEMGIKVDPEKDKVEVLPEAKSEKFAYYAFHKPVGYVCAVTGPEEPKITELIKVLPEKVFPIGRLDKMTSGLLILTNDGRFAYTLTSPLFEKEKEYLVKVREKITPAALTELSKTFFIKGRETLPAQVEKVGPHLLKIILKEGRNRQIRRMCDNSKLHIERLKRIRIGNIELRDLPLKGFRQLTDKEIAEQRLNSPRHSS